MRMTLYTDYSLRTLIYLAAMDQNRLCNIQEIADAYNISKNHLMKVIHNLGKLGRGRNGGFKLAKKPDKINIGELVRQTEDGFYLVDCMDPNHPNPCILTNYCGLTRVFREALNAYFQVLTPHLYKRILQQE